MIFYFSIMSYSIAPRIPPGRIDKQKFTSRSMFLICANVSTNCSVSMLIFSLILGSGSQVGSSLDLESISSGKNATKKQNITFGAKRSTFWWSILNHFFSSIFDNVLDAILHYLDVHFVFVFLHFLVTFSKYKSKIRFIFLDTPSMVFIAFPDWGATEIYWKSNENRL